MSTSEDSVRHRPFAVRAAGAGRRSRGPRTAPVGARPSSTGFPAARLALLGLLAALLLLPGCRLLFQEPTVRILDLELGNVGLTSATADVRVEVENPNWFELDLLGFAYELELEDPGQDGEGGSAEPTWVRLAEGHHDEALSVPAGETARLELEVPFGYEGMGAAVRSFLAQGTIPYRLQGDVEGRLLFWTLTFPFQAGGTIDMS